MIKVFLLFGPTQTCKSSTIRDLCGGNSGPEVGQGFKGNSTTKEPNIYKCINPNFFPNHTVYLIDTVGWGDSHAQFSDDQIMHKIQEFLIEKTKQSHIDGIMITESMMSDSITLKNSLARLSQVFGKFFKESSVVLATKSHASDPEDFKERFSEVCKIAEEQQIKGGVMNFHTSYRHLGISEFDYKKQAKDLSTILGTLKSLSLQVVIERREQLDKEAREIQAKETKVTSKVVYYQEVEYEEKLEHKKKPVVKTRTIEIKHKKRFLGIKVGHHTEYITEQYVEYQPYTEKVLIPKPVTRSKTETDKYVPDYQYCWNKAFAEFKRQIALQMR